MSRIVEFACENFKSSTSGYFMFANLRLLLCFLFFSAVGILVIQRRKYVQLIDKLPGPKAYFLIGNIPHVGLLNMAAGREKSLKILFHALLGCEALYKKGIFRLWFMTSPMIFISNFKAMETVAGSQTLTDKSDFYKFFEIGVGTGLTTSNGSKNKKRRKLINPAFHFRILERFLPIFNKNCRTAIRKIYQKLGDEHIAINQIITLYTLDSICETTMGVTIDAQNEGDRNYVKSIQALAILAVEQVSRPWLWLDFIFRRTEKGKEAYKQVDIFHDFSRKVIHKRLEEVKKAKAIHINSKENKFTSSKRVCFMDLLLEEHLRNKDFTLQDVAEEVDTFLVAGHDTSATATMWSLYLIGLHSEVQEKVHAEMDDIFDCDLERDITAEDIKKMKYLDCAFKESIRLYPPAPSIGRRITEDTMINGYLVPKDTECWLFIYALHRDPQIFPEPEKFDPDRFLPENAEGRHPFAYLPFSAGPRNCIGQKFAMDEVKILMANIFRHFKIQSLQPRDQLVPSLTAILHPPGPVLIKFRTRGQLICA